MFGETFDEETGARNVSNIFVKTQDLMIYFAKCWPGVSSWVDYLNDNAVEFWKSLYSYEHF